MMTLDISNMAILLDGIKNNHEVELVSASHRRIPKILEVDSRYVFFLRDSTRFMDGKYIYDENEESYIWVAVAGYGNFKEKVNSETVDTIRVSTVKIKSRDLDIQSIYNFTQEYLQQFGEKECSVIKMFSQDELIKKAVSHHRTTIKENLCFKTREFLNDLPILRS